jgi:hypothetical protein
MLMETEENISIEMIDYHDFSPSDSVMIAAWTALDMIELHGKDTQRICDLAEITILDLEAHRESWEKARKHSFA